MQKRERVLIFITIVLVVTFVIFFIYDRNKFVLKRTTPLNVSDVKIISMEKQGTLFLRTSYQAKIELDNDIMARYMDVVEREFNNPGAYMDKDEYEDEFGSFLEENYNMKPQPQEDTQVWICSAKEVDGAEREITYFFDIENDIPYAYIYYIR